jgi:hypothetical protein
MFNLHLKKYYTDNDGTFLESLFKDWRKKQRVTISGRKLQNIHKTNKRISRIKLAVNSLTDQQCPANARFTSFL